MSFLMCNIIDTSEVSNMSDSTLAQPKSTFNKNPPMAVIRVLIGGKPVIVADLIKTDSPTQPYALHSRLEHWTMYYTSTPSIDQVAKDVFDTLSKEIQSKLSWRPPLS